MGTEEISSSKWPGLVRQQNSKSGSFPESKTYEERKLGQSAVAASGRKLILLHDWWLVKADPDSHGKRLGIAGFALKENQGIRCFSSAPVVKRHDAVTLETVDGITLMVHGCLSRSRTLKNGFSQEVCDDFQIGFPYYWEDFVAISDIEEPVCASSSKGGSPSDAYKTPGQEAHGRDLMSEDTNNAILTEASYAKKKTTSADVAGGPLTRNRARLLATRR